MSKFTAEEQNFLEELFDLDEVDRNNVDEYLEPRVFEFLQKNGNLNTIVNKISFSPKTKYRYYESVIITKFLTDQVNSVKMIQEILDNISGRFTIFLDFHFLFICPDYEVDNVSNKPSYDKFKFQHASKASAMNQTIKINSTIDCEQLVNEFKDMNYADLLNKTFVTHSEIFEYAQSNIRPYQLLSLVIHIQKF